MKAPTPTALGMAMLVCSCGFLPERLEAFDVTLVPETQCTTMAAVNICVDPQVLAEQQTRARWIVEHADNASFLLTTHEGDTLAGVLFADDGITLNEAPCVGSSSGGGLCYFARVREESRDERNNDCNTFDERTIIIRRGERESIEALASDVTGTDANCAASTVVQSRLHVLGALAMD